jgi:hypothetical protein
MVCDAAVSGRGSLKKNTPSHLLGAEATKKVEWGGINPF